MESGNLIILNLKEQADRCVTGKLQVTREQSQEERKEMCTFHKVEGDLSVTSMIQNQRKGSC